MVIFEAIGYVFGYVLWFCFEFLKNYGLAIIVFTFIIRILMFPLSIKQQKSMAMNARMASKQQEIRSKYANDKEKMNQEIQKLYERENVSPASGCLTSFFPLLMMLGIFYSVTYPLRNTLHIASEKVSAAINAVNALPGMGISSTTTARYEQITFVTRFSKLKEVFPDLKQLIGFSDAEFAKIDSFSRGFDFLGLNLLDTPMNHGMTSVYVLIPILCFATSVLSSLVTMKLSNNSQNQQGCMKLMFILLPLFTAYIAYSVPAAVGFYWICSTVISFFITLVLNKFYNAGIMTAKLEAQRVELLKQQESLIK